MSLELTKRIIMGRMNARILAALFLATVVAAGCGRDGSVAALSPAERRAVEAARQWLVANGGEVENTTFEVREREGKWVVHARFWPAMPGGHATFVVDADGKVIEMWPGA
jgi:hypothetical protein